MIHVSAVPWHMLIIYYFPSFPNLPSTSSGNLSIPIRGHDQWALQGKFFLTTYHIPGFQRRRKTVTFCFLGFGGIASVANTLDGLEYITDVFIIFPPAPPVLAPWFSGACPASALPCPWWRWEEACGAGQAASPQPICTAPTRMTGDENREKRWLGWLLSAPRKHTFLMGTPRKPPCSSSVLAFGSRTHSHHLLRAFCSCSQA